MRRELLREGDTVRISLPAARTDFDAVITGFEDSHVRFEPVEAWPTWRRLPLTNVKARIQPPPRKHRRAA